MLKIESLYLSNYAGFNTPVQFNFIKEGRVKPINMFFGPNGCGKSTALNAITLLSRAKAYARRDNNENNLLLRKLQFHPDYDPNYAGFAKYSEEMCLKAVFLDESKKYIVHIQNEDVIQNDLSDKKLEYSVFIDADNPLNLTKFQLPTEGASKFLDLAKSIYGYDCYLEKPVAADGVDSSQNSLKEALAVYANRNGDTVATPVATLSRQEIYSQLTQNVKNDQFAFYQDFVIVKGDVKVHYKSMSAGERKIATLLRNLCDSTVMNKSDIVLVDNIEMHVYFMRHKNMIDKIIEHFPQKQFIVTSHSGIMIDHVGKQYGQDCLYDISVIKGQPLLE